MPYSALNSNYWRLNFENPSIGCRVMWRQHYDIHTDRHTYRHTDIHTYRQTDGTKLLYRRVKVLLLNSSFEFKTGLICFINKASKVKSLTRDVELPKILIMSFSSKSMFLQDSHVSRCALMIPLLRRCSLSRRPACRTVCPT